MKKKTSLISITQEEMKHTLAGDIVHPPVPVCTAYCSCTCTWDTMNYVYDYTLYNNWMYNKNGSYPG